jgi:poly-gamma-glutamate synthesis protein (capsule biosynthesis protein)
MRRGSVVLVVLVVGLGLMAAREWMRSAFRATLVVPAEGPISVAALGDVLITAPVDFTDPAVAAVAAHVGMATLAVANLELALLDAPAAARAAGRDSTGWAFGSPRTASVLAAWGLDVLSLANNHAMDYGVDGLRSTVRILDAAGIAFAGAGDSLDAARKARVVGTPGRVAVVAVTTSFEPGARATAARAALSARAGINPLGYRAEVTVDANTFRTLAESVAVTGVGTAAGDAGLMMSGTPIRRGERTAVEFVVDETDEAALLDVIAAARTLADVVVVSVHSHEPSNRSDQPAEFVRRFSRAAIDRGASLVIGHGPHRLRGVELYGGGAILYSLGNFAYQVGGIDLAAADTYDSGADLYGAAVGALDRAPDLPRAIEDPEWWEGAVATAMFDGGVLTGLRLAVVDLGADRIMGERGLPRLAEVDRSASVLRRLDRMSALYGTRIDTSTGEIFAESSPSGSGAYPSMGR